MVRNSFSIGIHSRLFIRGNFPRDRGSRVFRALAMGKERCRGGLSFKAWANFRSWRSAWSIRSVIVGWFGAKTSKSGVRAYPIDAARINIDLEQD